MILPQFDVLVPESIEEACDLLDRYSEKGVRILAGGTDLLVDLRHPIIPQHVPRCDGCPTHPEGQVLSTLECASDDSDPLMAATGSIRSIMDDPQKASPAYLISLHKLNGLKGIEKQSDGKLRIGALTTITEIEESAEIRANWSALNDGAKSLGSPLVRNRGTLGGNIVNARPAADTAVPTIALGAMLELKGPKKTRSVPASDFPTGPGQSVIEANEILTDIYYPAPRPYSSSAYYKLANRKALEISTVGVAVWMALEEPNGPVADVRVALGAVGPIPYLSKSAPGILMGKIPDNENLLKAAKAASSDARPIDDHRGSAQYRGQMVELLTHRLLKITLKRIREK